MAGGPNTYIYALGNSIRYTDPTGQIVPALVGCAMNPACRTLVSAGISAIIGAMSAITGALSDPCFDGSLTQVALTGALVGAASSFLGGAGPLVNAALKGGMSGFSGNLVGQIAAKESLADLDYTQAAISGGIGALSMTTGNVVGLQSSLNAVRAGSTVSKALVTGGSHGSAASTALGVGGGLIQSGAQNNNSKN